MYSFHGNIPVWGEHDEATLNQIKRCAQDEVVAGAALMADGHKGYSMPIGGVVAYRNAISPSGVGYDISCGNKAVRTNLRADDIQPEIEKIMDEIAKTRDALGRYDVRLVEEAGCGGRRDRALVGADRVEHGVLPAQERQDVRVGHRGDVTPVRVDLGRQERLALDGERERRDAVAAGQQLERGVVAQQAGAAQDEGGVHGRLFGESSVGVARLELQVKAPPGAKS